MLRNRWGILAVLFIVRATMAIQFQSVGAVAPLLSSELGFSIADIGILIGLYMAPGVALALPGGAIGQRLGDKTTVCGALFLMAAGSAVMALTPAWPLQVAGRVVGGAGGVILSVQLTKMLTDWFAGKEIATAMAIFINSWPVGIASSLILLPLLGTSLGVGAVHVGVAAFAATCLLLLAVCYSAPPEAAQQPQTATQRLDRGVILSLVAVGMIWGLFNVGFAMIFSFGPSMLVERGWSIAAAGSAISIVLWLSAISVPLGGVLADRLGRPQFVIIVAGLLAAALLIALPRGPVLLIVVVLGAICGLPAGPIMSLPARLLQPGTRAIGMGVFFTVYNACMMIGPPAAGALAKWSGSAASALDFGAALIVVCPLLLWFSNRIAAPAVRPA